MAFRYRHHDRVVRKLLWEISRLRNVVHRWYTYHRTVADYRHKAKTYAKDLNEAYIHDIFADVYEDEPVIMERMKPALPVILVTGYAHKIHQVQAAGFVVLSKPVKFATLLDEFTRALKKPGAVPLGKTA